MSEVAVQSTDHDQALSRSVEFRGFPKIARLNREMVVTEKIDGTNGAIGIADTGVYAQSRKRLITPEDDNFGFAAWVQNNAYALETLLGPGLHFGEWWGSGIQRGYGLENGERRFSLFNVKRWGEVDLSAVEGLGAVPVLYAGLFDTAITDLLLEELSNLGSALVPGFMRPEGIVIYHKARNYLFKATLENDDAPKSQVA